MTARLPLLERFMSRVSPEPTTGCWLWTAAMIPTGYGCMAAPELGYRLAMAHRLSYELFVGPLGRARNGDRSRTGGLYVCHRCDNRACVNPDHLFAGTHNENMADGVKKRRFRHDCDHPRATLSEDAVRAIRAANGTQRDIAKQFGTTQTTVYAIRNLRVYAGVK